MFQENEVFCYRNANAVARHLRYEIIWIVARIFSSLYKLMSKYVRQQLSN